MTNKNYRVFISSIFLSQILVNELCTKESKAASTPDGENINIEHEIVFENTKTIQIIEVLYFGLAVVYHSMKICNESYDALSSALRINPDYIEAQEFKDILYQSCHEIRHN